MKRTCSSAIIAMNLRKSFGDALFSRSLVADFEGAT